MSVYACSDLHGCMNLYKQIKSFLKSEDIVYFLGDAGDRGPDSWELIKAIIRDPQFIYLKGNHEDMLVKAANDLIKEERYGPNYYLLCNNGGGKTFAEWENAEYRVEYISVLKNLPLIKEYENKNGISIILSHAGFTYQGNDNIPIEKELLWDRSHFNEEWNPIYRNLVMVHGHTPICYIDKNKAVESGAFWYCNNHKVCIDNASFSSGVSCLLDLDSFDEHIFSV